MIGVVPSPDWSLTVGGGLWAPKGSMESNEEESLEKHPGTTWTASPSSGPVRCWQVPKSLCLLRESQPGRREGTCRAE